MRRRPTCCVEKASMYSLGDVQTSSKGIRSAPLTDETGSSVFIVACREKPLSAPFGASAYNDQAATRKNICLRCSDEIQTQFEAIDQYMASYIQEHSQRLFKGKSMTYKPALQQKEDYPPLLRCKINMAGTRMCRFWSPMFTRCDPPADLKECALVPRICVRGMWIMAGECGLQLEVTDIMCETVHESCPFLAA